MPWRFIIWLLYWVAAAIATHLPRGSVPKDAFRLPDWLLHGGTFFVLGALTAWVVLGGFGARSLDRRFAIRRLAIWCVILAAYAAIDEITQPLVGRTAELSDWAADLLGASLGLAVGYLWHARSRRASDAVSASPD
jgi:VanZ family protein